MNLDTFLQTLAALGIGALLGALLSVLLQAYFVKKEQNRQYFREFVLTPDFLQFMGAMESLQKGFTDKISDKTSMKESESILGDSIKSYDTYYQKLVSSGGTFLIPQAVWKRLDSVKEDLSTLLNKWGSTEEIPGDAVLLIAFPAALTIGVRLHEIRTFLKKYLGIPE